MNMRFLVLIFLCFLLGLIWWVSNSQKTEEKGSLLEEVVISWDNPGENAPIPRMEAQGLAVNGKLYVFGGFITAADRHLPATTQSHTYDLKTDTWTVLLPLPEKLTHAGQASDGNIIYLAGGFVGDHPGESSDRIWKYHIATDSWTEGPRMPGKRGGGALVLLEKELHFFGGVIRNKNGKYVKDLGDHWVLPLDQPNETWSVLAPLPNPRNHTGGCALDGKIFAIGGQHLGNEKTGNQKSVQQYDPKTNTWVELAELPVAMGHVTSNVLVRNGRILVVSGVGNKSKSLSSIYEYNPEIDQWKTLTPLPRPRQSPVSGIIGNRLVVSGGSFAVTTWIGSFKS